MFAKCRLFGQGLPVVLFSVEQLHREYLWAGADVIEAFSFYANDGKMQSADSARMYTVSEGICVCYEQALQCRHMNAIWRLKSSPTRLFVQPPACYG